MVIRLTYVVWNTYQITKNAELWSTVYSLFPLCLNSKYKPKFMLLRNYSVSNNIIHSCTDWVTRCITAAYVRSRYGYFVQQGYIK